MHFLTRIFHAPVLHFVGLGIVLYMVCATAPRQTATLDDGALPRGPDPDILYRAAVTLGLDREAAVVSQRLAQLGDFLELDGRSADQSVEQQARALGLVEADPVIRRHIEHLAELALQRGGAAVLPSEAEVARYYDTAAERFLEPPRIRMTQIYFSFERRGAAAEGAARAALQRLRSEQVSPAGVAAWGDPFVRSLSAGFVTRMDLERAFGAELAATIDRAPTATWTGPLRSPYGLHLVWVHERRAAARRPLPAVRNQIVHRLAREHSESLAARRLELIRRTAARHTP